MSYVNLRHPLIFHPGLSQRRRLLGMPQPDLARIDDRQLADMLNHFYEYSRQINFYNIIAEAQGEQLEINDWSRFFEGSIPFLLARIAKTDAAALEADLDGLAAQIKSTPDGSSLELLFDFIHHELFSTVLKWEEALDAWRDTVLQSTSVASPDLPNDLAFRQKLEAIIKGNLRPLLEAFIVLSNDSAIWHCTGRRNFSSFTYQPAWNLGIQDTYTVTNNYQLTLPNDPSAQILSIRSELVDIARQFMAAYREIIALAPTLLKDSLIPLHEFWQKYHEPHLGLLFTFLELFKHAQSDINAISQKHLDFFFKKVLRLRPLDAKPDQAHLVFEISNHRDQYPIAKGKMFKDGKDGKNNDIEFSLDDEIIIDKAKVAELKTLFLNRQMGRIGPPASTELRPIIEGVYVAPVANSADGQGEPFADPEQASWATLGAKPSKLILLGDTEPKPHPAARLGFALASPVLWLQEGKRRVVVNLRLDLSKNADASSQLFRCFLRQTGGILLKREFFLKQVHIDRAATALEDSGKKLCAETMSFLLKLLAKKNPYPLRENIGKWFDEAMHEVSCQPIFSKDEKDFLAAEITLDKDSEPVVFMGSHLNCAASMTVKSDNGYLPLLDKSSFEYGYLSNLLNTNGESITMPGNDPKAWLRGLQLPNQDLLKLNDLQKQYLARAIKDDKPPAPTVVDPDDSFPPSYRYYFEEKHFAEAADLAAIDGHPALFPDTATMGNPARSYLTRLLQTNNKVFIGKMESKVDEWLNSLEFLSGETYLLENIPNGEDLIERLCQCMENTAVPLFNIALSTEKEWFKPKPENLLISFMEAPPIGQDGTVATHWGCFPEFEDAASSQLLDVRIEAELSPDDPAIAFYNEEILKENIQLLKPQPVVKVELNDEFLVDLCIPLGLDCNEAQLNCGKPVPSADCCLGVIVTPATLADPYHFLRSVTINRSRINVEVCGMKKTLVLQNDESLLDPKNLIYPFGLRPSVPDFNVRNLNDLVMDGNLNGSSFYVGSKEVFFKKWDNVWLNIDWKERPSDFEEHYKAYVKRESLNPPIYGVKNEEFKIKIAQLENQSWAEYSDYERPIPSGGQIHYDDCFNEADSSLRNIRTLFCSSSDELLPNLCKELTPEMRIWVKQFGHYNYIDFSKPLDAFQTSTDGFLRFSLYGIDFFHKDWAYILARQMMATALLAQKPPVALNKALYIAGDGSIESPSLDIVEFNLAKADALTAITNSNTAIDTVETTITGILTPLGTGIEEVKDSAEDADTCMKELKKMILGPDDPNLIELVNDTFSPINTVKNETANLDFLTENDYRLTMLAALLAQNTAQTLRDFVVLHIKPLLDLTTDPQDIKELILASFGQSPNVEDLVNDLKTQTQATFSKFQFISGFPNTQVFHDADDAVTLARNFADNNLENFVEQTGTGLLVIANTPGVTILQLKNKIINNATNLENLVEDALFNCTDAQEKLVPLLNTVALSVQEAIDAASDAFDAVNDLNSFLTNDPNVDDEFLDKLTETCDLVEGTFNEIDTINSNFPTTSSSITTAVTDIKGTMTTAVQKIETLLSKIETKILRSALVPNEPWTPAIKDFSLDYTATAEIEDIELIHLYPYTGTSKPEEIEETPTLLPTISDEGTLHIGLKNLSPGSNLNLLFQLAEATADTELDRVELRWSYLSGNNWRPLRPGFELLDDATKGLTVSGIVKIAVPGDASDKGYSIMPTGFHWIKVALPEEATTAQNACKPSIASRVRAVAETVGVYAQAARATYATTPLSDLDRLKNALPAKSINRPSEADFNIKKVEQLYQSFGGKLPEASGNFYLRISEHLRHKGRAIAAFDIERLVLDAFPQIFKAKCIGHTLGLSARGYQRDLEVAPGFITLAVIPDLTKLKASDNFEPRCPVSLLDEVREYLRPRISPFIRLKVMNPRYERINVDIKVRLKKGKAKDFYAHQLKEDLKQFFAPWYLGDLDKITFGQTVSTSETLKFVECLDYVDFIECLKLEAAEVDNCGPSLNDEQLIYPNTARSILTGGEICVRVGKDECEANQALNSCDKAELPFKSTFQIKALQAR